jgi:hypothetical protein
LYCNGSHQIDSIYDLPSNESIIDKINSNYDNILVNLLEKIYDKSDDNNKESIILPEVRNQMIDKMCTQARLDIQTRIDLIKEHIRNLHKKLCETLKSIKTNVTAQIEKLKLDAEEECSSYSNHLESVTVETLAANDMAQSEIEKCKNYIDNLKIMDEKFYHILNKISFEPSDWIPDQKLIGNIEIISDISDEDNTEIDDNSKKETKINQ